MPAAKRLAKSARVGGKQREEDAVLDAGAASTDTSLPKRGQRNRHTKASESTLAMNTKAIEDSSAEAPLPMRSQSAKADSSPSSHEEALAERSLYKKSHRGKAVPSARIQREASADIAVRRNSLNTQVNTSALSHADILPTTGSRSTEDAALSCEAGAVARGLIHRKSRDSVKNSAAQTRSCSTAAAQKALARISSGDAAAEQRATGRHVVNVGGVAATEQKQDPNPDWRPSLQHVRDSMPSSSSQAWQGCTARIAFATRRAARGRRQPKRTASLSSKRGKRVRSKVRLQLDDATTEVMPEILPMESVKKAADPVPLASASEPEAEKDAEKIISAAEEGVAQYLENAALLLSGKKGFDDACASLTKLQSRRKSWSVEMSSRLDSLVEKFSELDEKRLSLELKRWLIGGPPPTFSPISTAIS